MPIADFALERYFARWEPSARYVLCASEVQGYPMHELVALADGESRAMWDTLSLDYTSADGHPLLRAEIATLYEDVSADEILVCSGADEAIYCLLNVLLRPGDHAIVVWPGYQSLYEVALATGADVTRHQLQAVDGWALDVDRLLAALRPNTRVVIVNVPHNPTGMLPTPEEWDRLSSTLDAVGVYLLSDEVYRFLELDGASPLLAGVDQFARGLSIGVMSKSFAMPGLRIGWLATHDRDLFDRVEAFKDYTTICASAPSEILALMGLRARDPILRRSRSIVEANLALLERFLASRSGLFSWVRPKGGSVGFVRLIDDTPIEQFAADLLATEGVLLLPASIFGYPSNDFRIGFGRLDMPEALAHLDAFVEGWIRPSRASVPRRRRAEIGSVGAG